MNPFVTSLIAFTLCGTGLVRAQDWKGLADQLIPDGVTPALIYTGNVAANTSGGEKRGATYFSILHLQLGFDGEKLAGTPGLTAFLDGLWINGGLPDKLVGDAQGVSSIAAEPALRLYEAWLQYNFDNRFSILAGRYDLNTEFYRLVSAGLFINASFGIGAEFGASGLAGPSIFPNTSLGVRFAYKPTPNTELRVAVLDGAPLDQANGSANPFRSHNGVLLAAEAAWLSNGTDPDAAPFKIGRGTPLAYDDKIAIGGWYYSASFNDLSGAPIQQRGEAGAYVLLDHLLYQSANDPKRRLSGFIQFGVADQVVDRFGTYIGAGLALSGLLAERPDDQVGIAMAMARNSSSFIEGRRQMSAPVTAAETSIELSYLAQIAPWLAIQPDVQYVIHPNTDPRLHDATVMQLRLQVTF